MEGAVKNAHPPKAVLALINPIVRTILRSPMGRRIPGLVVLEFQGRRSGRPITVVTGLYSVGGKLTLFSDAPWRKNFSGGRQVVITNRGRRTSCIGTLVEDPETVAAGLNSALRSGASARALGMKMSRDHTFTPEEAAALRSAIVLVPD